MDLYILTNDYKPYEIVDDYESLIWADRYSAFGDLELKIRSGRDARMLLREGVNLAITRSSHVQVIETVEDKKDADGNQILTVTAKSLERILDDRSTIPGNTAPGFIPINLTGTDKQLIENRFNAICRTGVDAIPRLVTGSYGPIGNLPTPTVQYTEEVKPYSLYQFIKEHAETSDLGFRLVRNPDTNNLHFDVYVGKDRTSGQSVYPSVIFTPQLDNLSNATELRSISSYKTIAYVFAKNGSGIVYADGFSSSSTGLERRVLVVDANDIDLEAGAALNAAIQKRGRDELAKNRPFIGFDGEVPQINSYIYGVDYNLGDLVELRNGDGLATNALVTEQLFISDAEGLRSYPTLTTKQVITPGTWMAQGVGRVWDGEPTDGYWVNE